VLFSDEGYTEPHPQYVYTDSDGAQSAWLHKHLEQVRVSVYETRLDPLGLTLTKSSEVRQNSI